MLNILNNKYFLMQLIAWFNIFTYVDIFASSSPAAEQVVNLIIKDHKFIPNVVIVNNLSRVKLIIENQDDTPEEFESNKLNREKIIPGKTTAIIKLPKLKPGEYDFFGEFHIDTALGVIKVIDGNINLIDPIESSNKEDLNNNKEDLNNNKEDLNNNKEDLNNKEKN